MRAVELSPFMQEMPPLQHPASSCAYGGCPVSGDRTEWEARSQVKGHFAGNYDY